MSFFSYRYNNVNIVYITDKKPVIFFFFQKQKKRFIAHENDK